MLKKFLLTLLLALALNLIWEFAHSGLYVNYQGGEITNLILVRAAVWDAAMITALILFAHLFKIHKTWFVVVGGFMLAIAIELWALGTGRWVYAASMPIIPILRTGLTPTIQLALTGYIAQKFGGRSAASQLN